MTQQITRQSSKDPRFEIKDLQPSERVFQLDRDTFLFYLGRSFDDISPFVRIGSGYDVPLSVLPYIENVLILEKPVTNIGQELQWFMAASQQGLLDRISYVGDKSYVNNVYKLVQLHSSKLQRNKNYDFVKREENLPMNMVRFEPPKSSSLSISKNRAIASQMREGNVILSMGTTRIFNTAAMQKGYISLDREYSMIEDVLAKHPCRLENKERRSFIWLQTENSKAEQEPFIYWNLMGEGVALNPCFNYHYTLFEQRIRPSKLKAFLAYDMGQSGFSECLRHKHVKREQSVVFTASSEELVYSFKRIYNQTSFQHIIDGNPIPTITDTSFFASRTQSHGAFSWRFDAEKEAISQVIFPLGGPRPRRNFNVIKPPHDVELQLINNKSDVNESMAHLALQIPVRNYSKDRFGFLRLRAWRYPLVPNKEYIFHQTLENNQKLFNVILSCLVHLPQVSIIRDFLALHFNADVDENVMTDAFEQIRQIVIPYDDFISRHNLGICFRFVQCLPNYHTIYTTKQRRWLKKLCMMYSPRFISYKTWLGLAEMPVEFHILLSRGVNSYLFVKPIPADLIYYKVPPSLQSLEQDPRTYSRQLRIWERTLGRSDASGNLSPIVALLEKFYEEKLRLLEERARFQKLMNALGLAILSTKTTKLTGTQTKIRALPFNFMERVSSFDIFRPFVSFLSFGVLVSKLSGQLSTWLSTWWSNVSIPQMSQLLRLPHWRFVPILLLLLLLVFGTYKGLSHFATSDTISLRGDSPAEIAATRLVSVGSIQEDQEVPGSAGILTPLREISGYVNHLAKHNGFRTLDAKAAEKQLRDPDIVFPGDILKLPDLRKARVSKGEYIWEIARIHYRRDFARLKILQRQIYALLEGKKVPKPKRDIVQHKQGLMKRLAVTHQMRSFLKETSEEVKRLLKL